MILDLLKKVQCLENIYEETIIYSPLKMIVMSNTITTISTTAFSKLLNEFDPIHLQEIFTDVLINYPIVFPHFQKVEGIDTIKITDTMRALLLLNEGINEMQPKKKKSKK